jgi:hypothetical protein
MSPNGTWLIPGKSGLNGSRLLGWPVKESERALGGNNVLSARFTRKFEGRFVRFCSRITEKDPRSGISGKGLQFFR